MRYVKFVLGCLADQRVAIIPGLKQLSYDERLDYISLWILGERRNRADQLEVCKIYKRLSFLSFKCCFYDQPSCHYSWSRCKDCQTQKPLRSSTSLLFSQATCNRDGTPQSIINSNTLNCFKNGLGSMNNTNIGFFMD